MARLSRAVTTLLVVEDSDEDFEAISRILRKLGWDSHVERCFTGEACLECLEVITFGTSKAKNSSRAHPCLILLDLNLPGMDGRDALREIKTDLRFKTIPVTILTTSSNPRDVQDCYAAGANAYVQKSLDYDEWAETMRVVTDFWLRSVVLPTPIP